MVVLGSLLLVARGRNEKQYYRSQGAGYSQADGMQMGFRCMVAWVGYVGFAGDWSAQELGGHRDVARLPNICPTRWSAERCAASRVTPLAILYLHCLLHHDGISPPLPLTLLPSPCNASKVYGKTYVKLYIMLPSQTFPLPLL